MLKKEVNIIGEGYLQINQQLPVHTGGQLPYTREVPAHLMTIQH
ncbi:MAG: hypothetical protein WAU23_11645 [Ferruginibacter sp.]